MSASCSARSTSSNRCGGDQLGEPTLLVDNGERRFALLRRPPCGEATGQELHIEVVLDGGDAADPFGGLLGLHLLPEAAHCSS
jgi:hypothetical protein